MHKETYWYKPPGHQARQNDDRDKDEGLLNFQGICRMRFLCTCLWWIEYRVQNVQDFCKFHMCSSCECYWNTQCSHQLNAGNVCVPFVQYKWNKQSHMERPTAPKTWRFQHTALHYSKYHSTCYLICWKNLELLIMYGIIINPPTGSICERCWMKWKVG